MTDPGHSRFRRLKVSSGDTGKITTCPDAGPRLIRSDRIAGARAIGRRGYGLLQAGEAVDEVVNTEQGSRRGGRYRPQERLAAARRHQ